MIAYIELNSSDIADIICDKFGVPKVNAKLTTEPKMIGQGPAEKEVMVPVATVTLTQEQMEEKGWNP